MKTIRMPAGSGRKPFFYSKIMTILILLGVLAAACAPATGAGPQQLPGEAISTEAAHGSPTVAGNGTGTSRATPSPEAGTVGEPTRLAPTLPEGFQQLEETPQRPVTGEVPTDLLVKLTQDLSSRLQLDPQQFEVIKAEAVVWNDGSLGCPQPGEFYTQALVEGYWVILQEGDNTYDYRASATGYFFLCEQPTLPVVGTPGR